MNLTPPNFDESFLRNQAQDAYNSHGKSPHSFSLQEKSLREKPSEMMEITSAEKVALQEMMLDQEKYLKHRIMDLELSIRNRHISNLSNAEEELDKLKVKLNYLHTNLGEKFFNKDY